MTFAEYAAFVEEMWFSPPRDASLAESQRSLMIAALGLGGESGELLEKIKKLVANGEGQVSDIEKELGDVLYYWTKLANHFGLDPEIIMAKNAQKLRDRKKRGVLQGNGDNR